MGSSATGPDEAIRLADDAVERLAERLRTLSDVRLARSLPPYASRADAARAVAQLLADLAASLEGVDHPAGAAPAVAARTVPRLHDFAVGDQVAVTGHDLVRAAARVLAQPPSAAAAHDRLPHADGRVTGAEDVVLVLARATEACRGLLHDL